ncbi:restriction endonuclease subunit S [Aliarcobacter cryaerophilus]|uniref:restriction endonuclease subunit S n=1 Tax=Aliarcobacter cryaerophilus TaxID=28198 RepID=UPI0021B5F942|nr:restriction endonuclease subunit S [Aliarcobacter cryaerophilus]MCT7524624.1 restriction endonuclease subunit S [Aliarcobacter cryaerophilus]
MNRLKRYENYKDSGVEWLGEIPEHWEIQKLKFNSKIETGNSISDSQKGNYENIEDESYPYIATKDINYDFSTIDYSNGLRIPINNKNFKISNPDTTLICIEGGSAGKKIAFNTQKICFVNKLASIQSINSNVPKFLYYLTKSYIFKKQFELSMNGLIGGVSISTMKNFELIFPPKEEQTKIASFLDEKTAQIDEVISQKEKLIELLKERKQIVINDAVTKGLDKDVEFVDSGVEWIGKIPKHWEISKLGTSLKPISIKNRADLPLLSVTREQGVILRDVDDKESNHNFIPDDLSGYKMVEKGQFAMNKMKAWQGSYGISDYTGIVSPAYFIFELNGIEPTFFHKAIRSSVYVPFFIKASDGVRIGQWDLSKSRMKEIPFYIPPKEEQIKIVEYIENQTSKIDIAIELQQNYISKLKEYKASLIDSVVTGKVKV